MVDAHPSDCRSGGSSAGRCRRPTGAAYPRQSARRRPGHAGSDHPIPAPVANPNAPETTTREETPTFKTRVNLVSVPVVVRDKQGRAVGGLQQEDFQLFDKNKPQIITKFSVEKAGAKFGKKPESPAPKPGEGSEGLPADTPDHFVAYLFDDVHLAFGDLVRVRDAAQTPHGGRSSPPTAPPSSPRPARPCWSSPTTATSCTRPSAASCPGPLAGHGAIQCPDISYYMADLIQNKHDPTALNVATQETMICANMDPSPWLSPPQQMARARAQREISVGDQEARVSLLGH